MAGLLNTECLLYLGLCKYSRFKPAVEKEKMEGLIKSTFTPIILWSS